MSVLDYFSEGKIVVVYSPAHFCHSATKDDIHVKLKLFFHTYKRRLKQNSLTEKINLLILLCKKISIIEVQQKWLDEWVSVIFSILLNNSVQFGLFNLCLIQHITCNQKLHFYLKLQKQNIQNYTWNRQCCHFLGFGKQKMTGEKQKTAETLSSKSRKHFFILHGFFSFSLQSVWEAWYQITISQCVLYRSTDLYAIF